MAHKRYVLITYCSIVVEVCSCHVIALHITWKHWFAWLPHPLL